MIPPPPPPSPLQSAASYRRRSSSSRMEEEEDDTTTLEPTVTSPNRSSTTTTSSSNDLLVLLANVATDNHGGCVTPELITEEPADDASNHHSMESEPQQRRRRHVIWDTPADENKMEEEDKVAIDEDEDSFRDLSFWGTTRKQPEEEQLLLYGGLTNLGNTCYMASALQMLFASDRFMEDVSQTSPSNRQSSPLRNEFFNVYRRLLASETVSPHDLKRILDDHTPLFHGYYQQDAHEFLTTFLDLLDEDFKSNNDKNNDCHHYSHQSSSSCIIPMRMEDETKTSTQSPQQHPHSSYESATKKPRTEEDVMDNTMEKLTLSSPPSTTTSTFSPLRVKSYSQLNAIEIDRLVHGDQESEQHHHHHTKDDALIWNDVSMVTIPPSCCKLYGGRMHMAEVEPWTATAYESSSPSSSYALQSMIDPMSNNLDNHPSSLPNSSSSSTSRMETVCSVASASSTVSSPVITTQNTLPMDREMSSSTNPSPIQYCFETTCRVRLTCDSCKFSRTRKETYLHFSLEIPEGSCCSVEEGLRRFFAPEKRELKCEKCFGESATQTMEITQLPSSLLFHLKRFIVEPSSDYSSISYRKNPSAVHFDPEMTLDEMGILSEFLAPDYALPEDDSLLSDCQPKYVLRSIVHHRGSSAQRGHYTADASRPRRLLDEGQQDAISSTNRAWMRFNDDHVTLISASEAILDEHSRETAYMILYEIEPSAPETGHSKI